MSWSITIGKSPDATDVDQFIEAGREAAEAQNVGAGKQIDAAKKAVDAIIKSGVLGEGPFGGAITGHVRQDSPNSASPMVTISLYVPT